MKNALLALTLLTSVSFAAEQSTSQNIYAGAGLGVMATDDNGDAGLGVSIKAGTYLDSVLKGMGIQAELNKSLSDPEHGNGRDIDVMTFALYSSYDILIPKSEFTLRPRIGAIMPNLNDDIDSRDLILSSGFGVLYDLQDNLRLYADYTVLGEAISNYSVGVEVKF
jgi:hypothetical protein